MALCQNVYRRGAVYWYRRRFPDSLSGRSRAVAFSLGVREPRLARAIGAALNARAHEIGQRLEAGMGTLEDAVGSVSVGSDGLRWHFTRKALDDLELLEARARPVSSTVAMTQEAETAILTEMAREAEATFAQGATTACARGGVDGDGRPIDARSQAIATDTAMAAIYRAIAEGGRQAELSAAERRRLAKCMDPHLVEFTEKEIRRLATEEALSGESWSLGPSRSCFEEKLLARTIMPNIETVMALRRSYLLICASLLEDHQRRHTASPVMTVLKALVGEDRPLSVESRLEGSVSVDAVAPTMASALSPPIASGQPTATVSRLANDSPIAQRPSKTFMESVETLIRQEVKSGKWDEKTAKQHRSVALMFIKSTGTNDASLMGQHDIGAFRSVLDDLPKNWGKSPADAARTIDEIKARAQDLDEDQIGLAPGTIDRQLTQLSNILKHLASNGFVIGKVTNDIRTGGKPTPRRVFSVAELMIITSSPVFTQQPEHRDALFWVTLLGHYELCRLHEICGLMIDDIDFEGRAILVRDNAERDLKTEASERRMPVVPELIRLGFFVYAAAMRDAGHTLLFPCLRRRGDKTPLSNLFYKLFVKLLANVLPEASQRKQSFHSLRKNGNTYMANANINDPIRHAVMGHAHSGANEKHYLDAVFDQTKLYALSHIPNVTAHLT